jgi:polyhydroxyalkanoate synthesis regulator phasin
MAARKRASSQSEFLNRAVKAGRSALREAEKRVPPDVRKQVERTIHESQKTFHTAIKQVQSRLDRTARQADLDRAMKRLEALTAQVRAIAARTTSPAPAARPARRKPATRKPAVRKPATAKPAAVKRAPAARPTKRAARTRRTTTPPSPGANAEGPDAG